MTVEEFKNGVIDSPLDLRDYVYDNIVGASEEPELPESFLDLVEEYNVPIQNQGRVGSCVAHSLMEMKSYIDNYMYSIGFIYGNRADTDFQGEGMIPREALKRLVKYGDCKKDLFDFNIEYPKIKEKMEEVGIEKLYKDAEKHKSIAYIRLYKEDIKRYLVKYKKPILIVCRVYDNFYNSQWNGGNIPSVPTGNKRGSHAMVILGYKKDELVIINSWGDYTGDKGKYYLDMNSNIITELWALEDEKNVNRPVKKKYTVGWNKDNTGWWYSPDGYSYYKSEWKQINGGWFMFDGNGYAYQNKWYFDGGKWYYLGDSCRMLSNQWFQDTDGKWYYLGPSGAMLTGWFQDTDGKWYYLDLAKGYMYSNCTILIDGKYYKFDSHGAWVE